MIGTLLLDAQGKTCYHGPETGGPSGVRRLRYLACPTTDHAQGGEMAEPGLKLPDTETPMQVTVWYDYI